MRTEPTVAEPAIVVADDWQGRGLASHLLDALVDRAREEGVERFVAPVLADNTAAIRLLQRLGETTSEQLGREVQLSIVLPAPGRASPPLHELLRAAATGIVEPARTIWQRVVWGRRPATARAAATRSWWARTARRARERRFAAPGISRASAAPRCTS